MKLGLMARTGGAAIMFAVATAATATNAQEAASDRDASLLGEVVVTARRTEERLQDVPVSVTAVTGETLQKSGIVNVIDLNRVTPGLSLLSGSGPRQAFTLVLRGQRTGTTVYFAEAPALNNQFAGTLPFYDLQNVQVLRGPQGTLFGVNSTGGALLLVPERPNESFAGNITVQTGSHNDFETQGGVGGPIIADKIMFRVAGEYRKRDGFTRNLFDGRRLDNLDRYSGRASLIIRPIEALENYTVVQYDSIDEAGTGQYITAIRPTFPAVVPFAAQLQAEIAARAGKNDEVNQDTHTAYRAKAKRYVNTTTWNPLENVEIKNIFAWQSLNFTNAWENDGSTLPIQQLVLPPESLSHGHTERRTNETQVRFNKLFDGKLDLVGGYFHIHDKPKGLKSTRAVTFLPVPASFIPFVPQLAPLQSNIVPFGPGSILLTDLINLVTNDVKQNAFYAHGDLHLADDVTFSAGVRRTKQRVAGTSYFVTNAVTATPTVTKLRDFRSSESAWSWDASLNWRITPDKMVYVAHRRGYNAGGFNTAAPADRPDIANYKPEFVTDYEAGLKADWELPAGVRARTNVDIYYAKFDDKQESVFPPSNVSGSASTAQIILNAAKARIWGIDLEAAIIFNDMFDVSGFYTLTDAVYTNFLDQSAPPPAPPIDRSGQRLQNSPKHRIGLTPRTHVPLGGNIGSLDVELQYLWQSKIATPTREPEFAPGAYSVVNLRADIRYVAGTNVSAAAWVNNLFDKVYDSGYAPTIAATGTVSATRGEPRMWGASLRYEW